MKRSLTLCYVVIMCVIVACDPFSQSSDATVAVIVSEQPELSAEVSPVSLYERERQQIIPTQHIDIPQTAVFDCSSDVADAPMTRHLVTADIHYTQYEVDVVQTVRYVNRESVALSSLVLTVEPNRWSRVFDLLAVRVENVEAEYVLDGKRLEVMLPEVLNPLCEAQLTLTFQLDLPRIGEGIYVSHGYFGYTERQLNLGSWLPTMAVYRDEDWMVHPAYLVGEQDVLPVADWDVMLSLIGEGQPPIIAAPGVATQLSDRSWRYLHQGAREFSVSMSHVFNVITQEAVNGTLVEVYSYDDAVVTVAGTEIDTAQHALDVGVHSFEMYSDLFGAYPFERLLIVQGDFPDGMEFSGLVFVGSDWFTNYPGNPASYLTLITVHEVAHQWWYALVGNDSAMIPWLDEALSTYSEYIFLEEFYPDLTEWWWQFRVNSFSPVGNVDNSVYMFDTSRNYINAVYLRGAAMMHAIRQDIGTEAFFDALYAYAEAQSGLIATPEAFWSVFTAEQLEATVDTRRRFLRQSQVLPDGG